jgi:arylsulfatase
MSSSPSRPNILFIMDDQHRFDYLGCAGAGFVHTPNIDRIAQRGVRFTQTITNCPLCAPARIGLASGQNPSRLGALGNNAFHPLSVTTHYQRLRDHGYQVGMVGKHDLAKSDYHRGRGGDRPVNYALGFTQPHETLGKMEAGLRDTPSCPYTHHLAKKDLFREFCQDYQSRRAKGWIIGASHDSVLPTEDFHDAYIGSVAVDWIENVPEEFPWYYLASFIGPHDPFDPPTEYAEGYRDAKVPEPISSSSEGKPMWQRHRRIGIGLEEITLTRRQYCSSITLIDEYVGRMLDALERRRMLDNTYIIFTSDHGEMLGDHGMYTKAVPYEASVRIPLIVAGPGVERGKVSDALVELIDVNPTVCELAGLPAQENIDARSFRDVLSDTGKAHREYIVSEIRNWRMIRTERYKFVENYNDVPELYDLQNDPDELHNIAEANPASAKKFRATLMERTKEGKWLR